LFDISNESNITAIDFFGFGINNLTLRYQVPPGCFHRFYIGSSLVATLADTSSFNNITATNITVGSLVIGSTTTRNPVLSNNVTQIARGRSSGTLINGNTVSVTFPFVFSVIPVVTVSIDSANLGPTVVTQNITTTSFIFICGNPNVNTSVMWVAVG
jgi:hypothetical protein